MLFGLLLDPVSVKQAKRCEDSMADLPLTSAIRHDLKYWRLDLVLATDICS